MTPRSASRSIRPFGSDATGRRIPLERTKGRESYRSLTFGEGPAA